MVVSGDLERKWDYINLFISFLTFNILEACDVLYPSGVLCYPSKHYRIIWQGAPALVEAGKALNLPDAVVRTGEWAAGVALARVLPAGGVPSAEHVVVDGPAEPGDTLLLVDDRDCHLYKNVAHLASI